MEETRAKKTRPRKTKAFGATVCPRKGLPVCLTHVEAKNILSPSRERPAPKKAPCKSRRVLPPRWHAGGELQLERGWGSPSQVPRFVGRGWPILVRCMHTEFRVPCNAIY